ncbi:MAG: cobyrinate a,c-diamide synthase [Aquabacterium sp.]|nr:cobyrinate a,c-diamide synthase [Aquabacterium sp.]
MTAAVLIAAPASGEGKTTLACALARLHARAGARVRAFKCGPDFLDPQWLALASGAPVHGLDLWINGEADCAQRLAHAAAEADLIIIEGVMGLHDGEPSAADLALRFQVPVLAVVDASAMAGTLAAVAHGLQTWRPGLPWAGVMANRVAGARHAQMLQQAVGERMPWGGALMRDDSFTLPSRHLGLAGAAELPDALARLDRAADALAATPLGSRPLADWPPWQPPTAGPAAGLPLLLAGRRIAVARDAAFAFIYAANLDTLRRMGAELRFFSPLAGDALPDCDAVLLPGGYPELHAVRLAERTDLREQLAAHLAASRPVWAECGGMMALADTLVDGNGSAHALWGLLPGTAVLGKRLAALGPHAWAPQGPQAAPGQTLRGHSFHWSRFDTPLVPWQRTSPARGAAAGDGEPIYRHGALKASWFHPWFASAPALAAQLFLPD